jgi:kanamycin kinase
MKKTLIDRLPEGTPPELLSFAGDARIFDSSCSPEARVYYVEKDGGYFIKTAPSGTLSAEATMTAYFGKKGLGAEVLHYSTDTVDWMMTSRVAGEDCTYGLYLVDPKRLASTIGERLRMLHETSFEGCPVMNRMEGYLALADENYKTGNYDKSHFPDSFGYRSAEEAYSVLSEGRGSLKNEVLLHGDYCLPNIMLDNWRFSGFIDVGNGGVGDRHIDLFWAVWTFWYNLKTNKYEDRFLDAYGRQNFDRDMLRVVAAFEVFG